ncbi:hypothetical protein QBC46DRAFT_442178 [Diplogelasinospora grovesii]|uniref:Uncharacterized protein n=1 Tax=Diplogelasinospora grovesii TaxID=303347 RepID=A0AAN6NHW8_9PEZI|nr:hypothetical protein QBC46DRAFT_442178 [Diplogelasinospora grovesii]
MRFITSLLIAWDCFGLLRPDVHVPHDYRKKATKWLDLLPHAFPSLRYFHCVFVRSPYATFASDWDPPTAQPALDRQPACIVEETESVLLKPFANLSTKSESMKELEIVVPQDAFISVFLDIAGLTAEEVAVMKKAEGSLRIRYPFSNPLEEPSHGGEDKGAFFWIRRGAWRVDLSEWDFALGAYVQLGIMQSPGSRIQSVCLYTKKWFLQLPQPFCSPECNLVISFNLAL